jgi:DNA repair protein RecN (Recombination protein N)
MLTSLAIRDVVLIEALELDFGAGLGVLTGETGAGKSILLDALGLALGARADSGLVRQGAAQAVVTASFDTPHDGGPIASLLAENALEIDPGEPLIIRRIVKADGGSRGFVNDQPASAGLLRELAQYLVEVHGQHDDRGLLNPRGHRALLDAFGRCHAGLVAHAYRAWRDAEDALAVARAEIDAAARDRDYLDHAVAELRQLAPEPGEEESLAERRQRLAQRGMRIGDTFEHPRGLTQPGQAAVRASQIVVERHHILGDLLRALSEALAALDRAINEGALAEDQLVAARAALMFDPRALEEDEVRLFDLRAMARKHRVQPDELAQLAKDMAGRLATIEAGEEGLAQLDRRVTETRAAYEAAADALSTERNAAAARLDAAVAGELAPLKLDAARFRTMIETLPDEQWGPGGKDRVEFEIATNPGAPFAPLTKIASGGELSRFILALKVSLAEEGGAATMIFDEIDRGVGGAVASAIGERLARLADRTQLLVVTHSPQVAARGGQHYFIAKSSDGLVTRTGVIALDSAARREEIARMLSGATITDEARAQAERLLEAA